MVAFEIRIRLEGQVEIIEAQILLLELATKKLRSAVAPGLVDATPSIAQERAERALRQLHEPSLDDLLDRLDEVRSSFNRALASRLSLLRANQLQPLSAALKAIEAEPLLFTGRVIRSDWWVWLVLASLALQFLLREDRMFNRLFWLGAVLAFGASFGALLWSGVRVVVTPKRLILGDSSFPLEQLLWLMVGGPSSLQVPPFQVRLTFQDQSRVAVRLPAFPVPLRETLQRLGVTVVGRGMWW